MIVPFATLVGAGTPVNDGRTGNGVVVVAVVNGIVPIVAVDEFVVIDGTEET